MVLISQQPAVDDSSESRSSREMMLWLSQARAWVEYSLILRARGRRKVSALNRTGSPTRKRSKLQRDFGCRGTVGRNPGQAGKANGLQILRHAHAPLRAERAAPWWRWLQHSVAGFARKWRPTRQHLEHQAAERKHIRCRGERLPAHLFRRRIKRVPSNPPARRPASSSDKARPKSRMRGRMSGPTMTLSGLRSR